MSKKNQLHAFDPEDPQGWIDFANLIKDNPNGCIPFLITRDDVELGDPYELINFIDKIPKKMLPLMRDRIHIAIDGYNDHPEEIYELPEVRAYFEAAETHGMMDWMYYCCLDTGSLSNVLLCTLKNFCKTSYADTPRIGVSFDKKEVAQWIANREDATGATFIEAGYTEDDVITRLVAVAHHFGLSPDDYSIGTIHNRRA